MNIRNLFKIPKIQEETDESIRRKWKIVEHIVRKLHLLK